MLVPTLLTLLSASTALASSEWPIPIPASLLPTQKNQHAFRVDNPSRPDNVRLIQTVEGRYQWTGDIEKLLREGMKLMDVHPRSMSLNSRSRITGAWRIASQLLALRFPRGCSIKKRFTKY